MDVRTTHGALLSRLLPGDEPDGLPVRQGQFHTVVIGSERVVRLPRTPAAAARLSGGAAVLRALAGLGLGVRTPRPLALGGTETPYLVLTRVPGEPLPDGALDDARVAAVVAAQYAALLEALARAGAEGPARTALPRARADRWRRFAVDVRAGLFPLMSGHGRRRAERELAAVDGLPRLTGAVVHGDLGAENVLWEWADGLPRLAGVIDWDGAELGDPAEDFAAVGAGHGAGFLAQVLALGAAPDGRGLKGSDDLMARIAAIRGTFALQQALAALHDGDDEELADGLAAYR
ncbi:phosphotransferase family protein [Kitasatospora sp. NPDC058115]|uniref:phosphotransferase family protein n=1 Tax=Kitasatospora sp. NPDC058115 TaxID=3346347 RepID=UPI0036DA8791